MSETLEKTLKIFSIFLILLICMTGVYSARGLYADGSYWLVEMLPRGGFYIFDPHREYVQRLVQIPVALAIWLGTLDLNLLIRLHNLGFIGLPLIFWIGALALHFRNNLFWLFLMAFSVSYLRSNFFAAGEFSTAYAMTAFCAAILLRQQLNFLLALLLLFTSICLTHSYEATLFLGAFLAALTLIRLFKIPTNTNTVRIILVICVVVFLISLYVGARSVFQERAYSGSSTANLGALAEIHLLYLILLPLLISTLACQYFQRIKYWILACTVLLVCLYLLYAFRWDQRNISYGFLSYAYRALCCFLLLFVLSLASILRFWPERINVHANRSNNLFLAISATVFFTSMSYLMLYHTYGYYKWIKRFEQEAISLKVHTPIDKTSINTNHGLTYGYNWGWGNPSTSILLRGNAEAMILNSSKNIGNSDDADNKGTEPGDFENTKEKDSLLQKNQPDTWTYRLKPFIKQGLLFP